MTDPVLDEAVVGLVGQDVWSRAGLRIERAGPVVTAALAGPEKRNAQRPETWLALDALGRILPGDVRVVVVRGDGPSFSAGIDLSVLADQTGGQLTESEDIAAYQDGFTWLSRPDLLTV